MESTLRNTRLAPFMAHRSYHLQLRNLFGGLFVYTNTVFRMKHYRKLPEIYKLFCRRKKFVPAKGISKAQRKALWVFGYSNWCASPF